MEWNGMEWHGMEWNGMTWNGMEWNDMEWNGMEWHGVLTIAPHRLRASACPRHPVNGHQRINWWRFLKITSLCLLNGSPPTRGWHHFAQGELKKPIKWLNKCQGVCWQLLPTAYVPRTSPESSTHRWTTSPALFRRPACSPSFIR